MALRLVFMGTPEFSVPCLDALVARGHEVAAVYSQPPRPAGRGMADRKSPVHVRAEELGIPVLTPRTLKSAEALCEFSGHAADAAVVVAYGLLLPRAVLDAPRHGCFNVHASALPRGGYGHEDGGRARYRSHLRDNPCADRATRHDG
jgi:methionyl-tRNA formyltransferase